MTRLLVLVGLTAALMVGTTRGLDVCTVKVNIDIYYETMNEPTARFFDQQWFPVWQSPLKENMNTTFIPFGFTQVTKDKNAGYSFRCPKGPAQCYGNKVQACAVTLMNSIMDTPRFVWCSVTNMSPNPNDTYPGEICANELNIEYDATDRCASSERGDELLAAFGEKTKRLAQHICSLPTVVFEGVFNKTEQELALCRFKDVLLYHIQLKRQKQGGANSQTCSTTCSTC